MHDVRDTAPLFRRGLNRRSALRHSFAVVPRAPKERSTGKQRNKAVVVAELDLSQTSRLSQAAAGEHDSIGRNGSVDNARGPAGNNASNCG